LGNKTKQSFGRLFHKGADIPIFENYQNIFS